MGVVSDVHALDPADRLRGFGERLMRRGRMRAAIYARYSSENQRLESIEDQVSACKRLAADRGFKVLEEHIYFNEAESDSVPSNGSEEP